MRTSISTPLAALVVLVLALLPLSASAGPAEDEGGAFDFADYLFMDASDDGKRIVFSTPLRLAPNDKDANFDLYLRSGKRTRLISIGPAGGNGPFDATIAGLNLFADDFDPVEEDLVSFMAVSADGKSVLFETAEPLTAADQDTSVDLYRRADGVTTLVSTGLASDVDALAADGVGASEDHTRVFFNVGGVSYERSPNGTKQLEGEFRGASADGRRVFTEPGFVGASRDGRRVFFVTEAALSGADLDSSADIYERFQGRTKLISQGPAGGKREKTPTFLAASEDGSRVFFATEERLVREDDASGIFGRDLYERKGSTTTLVSEAETKLADSCCRLLQFGDISADGKHVLFTSDEPLTADDRDTSRDVFEFFGGRTTKVSEGPTGGNDRDFPDPRFFDVSADGSRIVFGANEPLTKDDRDGRIFDLYQREGGNTTLLSTGPAAGAKGRFFPFFDGASRDGRRVFFDTLERLTRDDRDRDFDLYERVGNRTALLSKR